MSAKKTAARNRPATKAQKAKPGARKALKAKPPAAPRAAAKAAPKSAPKLAKPPAKKSPVKAAAKRSNVPATAQAAKSQVVPVSASKPIGSAIKVKPVPAKAAAPKKAAAAASSAKPALSKSFDPDRRRELIAAAAARRRKAAGRDVPIAIIQPREPSPVEQHRFSIGDQVRVISTSGMWFKHGVDYRVTAALPPQSGKLQYRIKNPQEPFERVVSESQLAVPAQHAHA